MTLTDVLLRLLPVSMRRGRVPDPIRLRGPENGSQRPEDATFPTDFKLHPAQEQFYEAIKRGDRVLITRCRSGNGALLRHIERECERDDVPFRWLGTYKKGHTP